MLYEPPVTIDDPQKEVDLFTVVWFLESPYGLYLVCQEVDSSPSYPKPQKDTLLQGVSNGVAQVWKTCLQQREDFPLGLKLRKIWDQGPESSQLSGQTPDWRVTIGSQKYLECCKYRSKLNSEWTNLINIFYVYKFRV
ncbi:hypothetical protein Y1Q_0002409 [Alligator mississippiensis]|uniref:Uncharacterized protein n=1 Tax=Alligator mississippiensis TaxID=8496 RepID=A0A151N6I0_ALLMI|nr:hypothetical protein Y1Q_0002409 [Alligator mississippiensis]